MLRRTFVLELCVVSIALVAVQARAQSPTPRAFVLDGEGRSLTAIDVASGKALNTAALQGQPGALIRMPGGRWLVVLDRGPGQDAGEAGYQAKGKSSATIVEAATLAVQARVELGWGLDFAPLVSPEGDRLSFVCPGYQAKKPEDVLPSELVTVDLASGRVVGRLALPRPATAFFNTPDGKTGVILSGRDKPHQTPALPAELRLVDLAGPSLVATLTLEGDPRNPVLSADVKFVYLLDAGNPSGNPDKNVNGRLHVVSLDARKVDAMLDVGSKPRGLVLDEAGQQLLLLSDEPPVKGQSERVGELRVIRGPAALPPIKVAKYPELLRAAPKVNRLFVFGNGAITTLELPDFKPLGSTPVPRSSSELTVSPDGKRGFVLNGDQVVVVDLEAGKSMGSIRTGRMSALILNAVTAAVDTEVSKRAGQQEAARKGQSYYSYTEYTLKDPSPSIAVHPDGRFAYVLNNQTRDVTIVDAASATVVDKIGGAGFDIQFLTGGAVVAILSDSVIHLVDTASNKKLADLTGGDFKKDEGFKRLEVSPDGKYAVARGPRVVFCLDGSAGTIVGHAQTFKRVVGVAYAW